MMMMTTMMMMTMLMIIFIPLTYRRAWDDNTFFLLTVPLETNNYIIKTVYYIHGP